MFCFNVLSYHIVELIEININTILMLKKLFDEVEVTKEKMRNIYRKYFELT